MNASPAGPDHFECRPTEDGFSSGWPTSPPESYTVISEPGLSSLAHSLEGKLPEY